MLSQNTLVWVGGATASTVVVAGAVAGALLLDPSGIPLAEPCRDPVVASAPEPKTAEPFLRLRPLSRPPAPAASASAPGGEAASEAAASPLKPAFDVVNVEPTGEAVIAGRAAPNAKVELRDAGKTVAEATADASGQFVIIPPTFAPGDHSLSLAADAGKAAAGNVECGRRLGSPAGSEGRRRRAAAAETAAPAPSPPALAMRTLATSPPAAASRVAIQSVEADAAGGLVARGSAEPNATVRLYLNGADVADAKTQSDGRWSLTIKHGMTPGGYVMRADEINPGDASVVASANTPFDYPAAPASVGRPPRRLRPRRRPPGPPPPQARGSRQDRRPPTWSSTGSKPR